MILLSFILLLCIPYAIVKGISDTVKQRKREKERINTLLESEKEEAEKEEIEKLLLLEKLNGYNAQLESYSHVIAWLEREEKKEEKGLNAALIRKKQADLSVKAANIAEKAYKLQNKLDEIGEG